jgi:hypothetical protein
MREGLAFKGAGDFNEIVFSPDGRSLTGISGGEMMKNFNNWSGSVVIWDANASAKLSTFDHLARPRLPLLPRWENARGLGKGSGQLSVPAAA